MLKIVLDLCAPTNTFHESHVKSQANEKPKPARFEFLFPDQKPFFVTDFVMRLFRRDVEVAR